MFRCKAGQHQQVLSWLLYFAWISIIWPFSDLPFPSPVRRPQFGQNILLTQIHIKKARDPEFHRSSRTQGSRIAFQPRISNAEAHAVCILTGINNITNGHWSIALPCGWIIEFARFSVPQIRRWLNAFYICLSPAFRPSGLRNEQRGKNTKKLRVESWKLRVFFEFLSYGIIELWSYRILEFKSCGMMERRRGCGENVANLS